MAAFALLASPAPLVLVALPAALAYVAAAGILGLVGPRLLGAPIAYPSALLDVGAVTVFVGLVNSTSLPLWVLYVFPLVTAAMAGRGPALAAAVLSVAGWEATSGLAGAALSGSSLWTAVVLASAAAAFTMAISRRAPETGEKEALRRERILRHAAADLLTATERRDVAQVVAGAVASGLGALADDPDRGPAWTSEAVGERARIAAGVDRARLRADDVAWLDELQAIAHRALDRCAAHDDLRREAERDRTAFEALPAPFALWLPDGTPVLANAAYRALGLGDAPPPSTEAREEEVSLGDPPRTFVAATIPVGPGLGVAALYREVTREREALRAKDELIALIGHELRNPLTSLHGYTQMMARQLGTAQHQVDRLNQLIGDFMDAARLEVGQLPLRRQPVDLVEIATGAAERFRAAHAGRSLRLELAEVAPVAGDPVRLGQVVDNLLGNAAKYAPADSEVVLTVRMEADRVVLSVQDHGAGIAAEHLPHLFDRFYRAPGPETRQAEGLGLGLAIVRDLVAAHGGQAWAESGGPGQGSTFSISLPPDRSVGRGSLEEHTLTPPGGVPSNRAGAPADAPGAWR